jgi:hypothetical protein
MFYELVSPDGCVAAAGEFTDTDAKAPRNGLIDRLATVIAVRESEGLQGRERANGLRWDRADMPAKSILCTPAG